MKDINFKGDGSWCGFLYIFNGPQNVCVPRAMCFCDNDWIRNRLRKRWNAQSKRKAFPSKWLKSRPKEEQELKSERENTNHKAVSSYVLYEFRVKYTRVNKSSNLNMLRNVKCIAQRLWNEEETEKNWNALNAMHVVHRVCMSMEKEDKVNEKRYKKQRNPLNCARFHGKWTHASLIRPHNFPFLVYIRLLRWYIFFFSSLTKWK